MAIGFELQGVQGVLDHFRAAQNLKKRQVERGLRKAGLFLLRQSLKVVPVDTGALKNSGRLHITGSGFGTIVWIEYGMNYAIYVHENMSARHKPGKIAKFVETPMRENAGKISAILLKELSMRT
jgi:hypothetical protein